MESHQMPDSIDYDTEKQLHTIMRKTNRDQINVHTQDLLFILMLYESSLSNRSSVETIVSISHFVLNHRNPQVVEFDKWEQHHLQIYLTSNHRTEL